MISFISFITVVRGDCAYLNDETDIMVYKFTSDCTTDDSGNSNDATNEGAENIAGGKLGNGCSFTLSETDYIEFDSHASDINGGDITMCLWFKANNLNQNMELIHIAQNAEQDYYRINHQMTDGSIYMKSQDGLQVNIRDDGNSSAGSWTSTCLVADNIGHISHYLNGELTGNVTTGTCNMQTWDIGRIGVFYNFPALANYYDGVIDEVHIWNRKLNANEISDWHNNGDGCDIYASSPVNPGLTLTQDSPNDSTQHTEQVNFLFTGTVSNSHDDNFNCSFYMNDTLKDTLEMINISEQNNFSYAFSCFGCNFNVTCYNNNASDSIIYSDIFIDLTQPVINIFQPTNTSFQYIDIDYYHNITFNDSNFDGYNISYYLNNSGSLSLLQQWYAFNLSGGQYNIYNETNSSDWCATDCNIYLNITAWDSHNEIDKTHEKIKDIDKRTGYVKIFFEGGYIEINDTNLKDYDLIDEDNKYKEKIKFETGIGEMIIRSNTPFYFKQSEYKGHLVFPYLRKYKDFMHDSFIVTQIEQINLYEIKISYETEKNVLLKSIGDLNINSKTVSFTMIEQPSADTALLTDINKTLSSIDTNTYNTNENVFKIYEVLRMLGFIILFLVFLYIGLFTEYKVFLIIDSFIWLLLGLGFYYDITVSSIYQNIYYGSIAVLTIVGFLFILVYGIIKTFSKLKTNNESEEIRYKKQLLR